MSEKDENIETEVKTKQKRKEKKAKKERKGDGRYKESTKEFFLGIWKFISFFLKIILAPFWFTVVLFIKAIKFLREKGDHLLTDEDKRYLSLIPSLFFMMCVSIIVTFLIFYFGLLDKAIEVITSDGFWPAVGLFFTQIGLGIFWLLKVVFVDFLYGMIIQPFGDFMQNANYFWATLIIVIIIILLVGLGLMMYHLMKTQKLIKAIGRFFKKIWSYPKSAHNWIREKVVLKYLVGEKYVATKPKSFFWGVVLIQFIITIALFILAIVLGVVNYIQGIWIGPDIFEYSLVVAGILFLVIGIFSTWFFVRVYAIATKVSEEAAA